MSRRKKMDLSEKEQAPVIPFPRKPFEAHKMTPADQLLSLLEEAGFSPSPTLKGSLRIQPWQKGRGGCEFFDFLSTQPVPYTESDSPSACFDNGKNAPDWIKRWYLSVVSEHGKKFLVFVYVPKRVFIKCELEKAEELLPAIMQEHTMNPRISSQHGPIPPSSL